MGQPDALIAYFGYGSLVNRLTHRTDIVSAGRARLSGWRRFWRPRPDMRFVPDRASPLSLLTVGRDAASAIDGLLVIDRAEHLPAVDEREMHYDRRQIAPADLILADGFEVPAEVPLYVYEAQDHAIELDGDCPILQSYLDAVLQGFITEYGEEGMRSFVLATGNFETPVLADRAQPHYPRAVALTDAQRHAIDRALDERGVRFITL